MNDVIHVQQDHNIFFMQFKVTRLNTALTHPSRRRASHSGMISNIGIPLGSSAGFMLGLARG
jgi:hypothetical protein